MRNIMLRRPYQPSCNLQGLKEGLTAAEGPEASLVITGEPQVYHPCLTRDLTHSQDSDDGPGSECAHNPRAGRLPAMLMRQLLRLQRIYSSL